MYLGHFQKKTAWHSSLSKHTPAHPPRPFPLLPQQAQTQTQGSPLCTSTVPNSFLCSVPLFDQTTVESNKKINNQLPPLLANLTKWNHLDVTGTNLDQSYIFCATPSGHTPRLCQLEGQTCFPRKTSCGQMPCRWPRSLISSRSPTWGAPRGESGASSVSQNQSVKERSYLQIQATANRSSDFSGRNDKLSGYNRKISNFSLLSLGWIHLFSFLLVFLIFSSPAVALLKTHPEKEGDCLSFPSMSAKIVLLPLLLPWKPWWQPFDLGSCSSSFTLVAQWGKGRLVTTSNRRKLWIWVLPALLSGTQFCFCGYLFYLVRVTS